METQQDWDVFISKEGLHGRSLDRESSMLIIVLYSSVMDVYSGWCGPCKAVTGLFRRLKNEIGDDLLRFAIVSLHCSTLKKICLLLLN